jgi:hypothetical protein
MNINKGELVLIKKSKEHTVIKTEFGYGLYGVSIPSSLYPIATDKLEVLYENIGEDSIHLDEETVTKDGVIYNYKKLCNQDIILYSFFKNKTKKFYELLNSENNL